MSDKMASWKKLWRDLGTRRWIFLLVVGILLVVIAVPVEKKALSGTEHGNDSNMQGNATGVGMSSGESEGIAHRNITDYETSLEVRLAEILSQIQGAGAVHVMVTVNRSSELILQSDISREENTVRESDPQGGSRDNAELREESQTVLVGGSSTSQPYVIGEIMPLVEGVVVACEGGDRPSVQAEISEAIQALFDLQPHKIKVCKMASP